MRTPSRPRARAHLFESLSRQTNSKVISGYYRPGALRSTDQDTNSPAETVTLAGANRLTIRASTGLDSILPGGRQTMVCGDCNGSDRAGSNTFEPMCGDGPSGLGIWRLDETVQADAVLTSGPDTPVSVAQSLSAKSTQP